MKVTSRLCLFVLLALFLVGCLNTPNNSIKEEFVSKKEAELFAGLGITNYSLFNLSIEKDTFTSVDTIIEHYKNGELVETFHLPIYEGLPVQHPEGKLLLTLKDRLGDETKMEYRVMFNDEINSYRTATLLDKIEGTFFTSKEQVITKSSPILIAIFTNEYNKDVVQHEYFQPDQQAFKALVAESEDVFAFHVNFK